MKTLQRSFLCFLGTTTYAANKSRLGMRQWLLTGGSRDFQRTMVASRPGPVGLLAGGGICTAEAGRSESATKMVILRLSRQTTSG